MSLTMPYTEAATAADLLLIEAEHTHLAKILCELYEFCDQTLAHADCKDCERLKVAACQGRLPSFFHDFREFACAHFEHEENIINDLLLYASVSGDLRDRKSTRLNSSH